MFQKKDVVFAFILIYLFLVMLFFVVEEKDHKIDYPCGWSKPCLRFCCQDTSTCKEKYIRETFNQSLLEIDEDFRNETEPFSILLGKPKCLLKLIRANDSDYDWEFSYVSFFYKIPVFKFIFNFGYLGRKPCCWWYLLRHRKLLFARRNRRRGSCLEFFNLYQQFLPPKETSHIL
jgi:hypothetical protein